MVFKKKTTKKVKEEPADIIPAPEAAPAVEPEQPEFVPPKRGVPAVEVATKAPERELPVPGPKEKLFECPMGCIKIGSADRNSDWCGIHSLSINPKR